MDNNNHGKIITDEDLARYLDGKNQDEQDAALDELTAGINRFCDVLELQEQLGLTISGAGRDPARN
jgi:hypothetical protein